MKASLFALLVVAIAIPSVLIASAQVPAPTPACTSPTLSPSTRDSLANEVVKALAEIPATGTTPEQEKMRALLSDLLAKLKAETTCAEGGANFKTLLSSSPVKISPPTASPDTHIDLPSTKIGVKSISLGLSGADSFNREIKGTAAVQYQIGSQPAGGVFFGKSTLMDELLNPTQHPNLGNLIFNVSATYDDKWKAAPSTPGAANFSNLSQQYSAQVLHLSNMLGFHAFTSVNFYHDNSMGIRYDVAPDMGIFFRWPRDFAAAGASATATAQDPKCPCATNAPSGEKGPAIPKHFLIVGLAAQADIDKLYSNSQAITLGGLHAYLLWNWTEKSNSKNSLGFNLKGFLPGDSPTTNGHGLALFTYDYKITPKWSLSFTALDSYYSTVPATYSHNSLTPTLGLKFVP